MIAALAACAVEAPQVSIVGGDPARIEVRSTSASIAVVAAGADGPMAGTTTREDGVFVHRPAAPLVRGASYTIIAGAAELTWEVAPPDLDAFELAIYPSAEVLPRNALKVYLHSTVALRVPPSVSSVVRLVDDEGVTVDAAFVETPIVAPDRRWLTVLFHPGRQKTGIGFGEGVASVLEEGRRYTLLVSGELADAAGRPLGADRRWVFTVGPEDRAPPEPGTWRVERGGGGLVLSLDEPVDAVLAPKAFLVEGRPATALLGPGERSLVFPAVPGGPFTLALAGPIEDLAANTPGRPFEARSGERGVAVGWSTTVP